MKPQQEPLEQLADIKAMMERSSRFISLSGWSGISAGLCALVGAYVAHTRIKSYYENEYGLLQVTPHDLLIYLMVLATIVFICAFSLAFLFTYKKSRQHVIPVWGQSARRLLWNTLLPMLVGGVFILQLMHQDQYQFVASACLLFYGLGLLNGSKYTLGEVRYLAYAEILAGMLSLFFIRHGLLFWTLGFGFFHILYGVAMWWKYDRTTEEMK
jgi:hypothetical protein